VVYDPSRGVLYASVNFGPGAGIYPIDPVTGIVGSRMVSGATYQLAIADDGSYLYGDQQSSVVRINLATQSADLTFAIPIPVEDIHVRPGHADTVALSLKVGGSPRSQGVRLYQNATQVGYYFDGTSTNALAFDGPDTLYASDEETSARWVSKFTIDPSGIHLAAKTQSIIMSGFGFEVAGGLIYSTGGEVWDPADFQLVGTNFFGTDSAIEVDPAANRVFIIGSDYYGQQISVYEADTHSLQAQIQVPTVRGSALVRWGADGLAYVGVDRITLVQSDEILNPTISPFPSFVAEGPGLRRFDISTVDLAYHQASGRLLATTYGDVEDFGNSVLVIEPQSGNIEQAIYAGSGPTRVSQTSDGQALFVALGGESSVSRLGLLNSGLTQFGIGRDFHNGPLFAEDLAAVPGTNNSAAVSLRNPGLSPRNEGVALYDAGIQRPSVVVQHGGNNLIEAADAATIYGSDVEISPGRLNELSIGPDGLHKTAAYDGFAGDYEFSGGLFYSATGRVVDPTIPAEVANLNMWPPGPVEADPATDRLFLAASDGIRVHSLSTYAYERTIPAPFIGLARSLVRWGDNGLAYNTDDDLYLVNAGPEGSPTPVPPPGPPAVGGTTGLLTEQAARETTAAPRWMFVALGAGAFVAIAAGARCSRRPLS
jgi:hypothetical protein